MPRLTIHTIESVGFPQHKSGKLAKRTRRCGVCGAASYERCHRERHMADGAVQYVPLKAFHPGR